MKITVLMENTSNCQTLLAEHGLSLYIETKNETILADTGQSDKIVENANLLGIDLRKINYLVISHGHYDHAGGLLSLLPYCTNVPIFMQKTAGNAYYHGERYIGIDPHILELPQLRLVDGSFAINENLDLFAEISGRRFWPKSNLELSEREADVNIQDNFKHEQCLVIHEDGVKVLISGCAHNGILNILDRFYELYACYPDKVFSGFHMMKKGDYTPEEQEIILQTARELKQYPTVFYTGHCTGQKAFDLMKEVMGDQLVQIHGGDCINTKEGVI